MQLEKREALRDRLMILEGIAAQLAVDTRNSPLVREKARLQLRELEEIWKLLSPRGPSKEQYTNHLGATEQQ